MSEYNPDLEETLIAAFRAMSGEMRIAIPGYIIAQTGRTVSCSSSVPFRRQNEDTGLLEAYQPSPIAHVPVYWEEGSGSVRTRPLTVGQRCFLIFSDRALDTWKANVDGAPISMRRFDLADAFCLPGGRPPGDPLPAGAFHDDHVVEYLPGAMKMRVGDKDASDPVSLSSLVDANFSSLAAAINVFVTAWNATQPGGGPVVALPATPLIPVSTSGTGSSKLETE